MEVSASQPSRAEQEKNPAEYNAFDLGKLDDSRVVRLVHMFGAEWDALSDEEFEESERSNTLVDKDSYGLWELLQHDLQAMIYKDPERAVGLLSSLKSDKNVYGRDMAASWAPFFVPIDFELARDTLLELRSDPEVSEAVVAADDDFKSRVTPEQYREYEWRSEMAVGGDYRRHLPSSDAYRSAPGPVDAGDGSAPY